MIDVAMAIDAEAVTVSHKRVGAGSYSDGGKWTPGGAVVTTSIRAAVQPASGRQLMDVPEGIRNEAKFVAWSRSNLLVEDRIVVGTVEYKIIFVWPRPRDGFTRAALGQMK